MANIMHDQGHNQLVARLTTGFGAMLEQVQELASKNTELEQRLARVREEARYLTRPGGLLSIFGPPDWAQENQDGYTEPPQLRQDHSRSESGGDQSFMGTEDQKNAVEIADGVEAWNILTDGEGPLWRRHNAKMLHEPQARDFAEGYSKQDALPQGHPAVRQMTEKGAECPFAAMSHLGGKQETIKIESSVIQRPDSLPTPPHTQEHFVDDPQEDAYDKHDSPPPSISGSISKCPIRMLDERSPEEIAQFFENHKHEIPRSHEICVRRYQSNSQTIRELDAKYGNLANMIKGLGMKHQPLLPSKEDDEEDAAAMDTKSMRKVENWAHNVNVVHEGADLSNDTETHDSGPDDRQGHCDRPLKEIRVGESPSRPWGISVPAAIPHLNLGENAPTPTPKRDQTKARDAHVGDRARIASDHGADEPRDDKPRMLFTGPVFIGYGPEQAAALIKECELKTQGATV